MLSRVASDVESTIDFAQKSKLDSQRSVKRDITELLEEGTLKALQGLICKCHSKVLIQDHEEDSQAKQEMMQIDTGSGSTANKHEVKFDNLYDVLFNGAG